MTNKIPIHDVQDQRSFHQEEFEADQPFSSRAAMDILASQTGLFEYLSDEAISGNDEQRVDGHSHGRDEWDGLYVSRYGSFDIGHISPQSTTSTSYTAITWDVFNTGGPDSTGVEQSGSGVGLSGPTLMLSRHYEMLVLRVMLKADAGATATARLSLKNGSTTLVGQEVITVNSQWDRKTFELSIANNETLDGWRQLQLELKSSNPDKTVSICSDDDRFKPLDSPILNGLGLLIGENS